MTRPVVQQKGVVRFGAADDDGRSSQVWRLWLAEGQQGKSDIYIAPRGAARATKASLHESGECRAGFTREFEVEQGWDQLKESGHRQILQWRRPTDATAWSIPLTVRIPRGAVREQVDWGQRDAEVRWVAEPAPGHWVDFDIVIKGPACEWSPRLRARRALDELTLPNGESVRITYSHKAMSRRERRELAEMVAVMSDEEEVAASTMLLPPENGRVIWIDLPT